MDSRTIFSPRSFLTASTMIQIAAIKISSDSITPEIFQFTVSVRCLESGGLSETLTEKKSYNSSYKIH